MYCPPLKTTVPLLVWAISQRYNTSSKLSFILLKLFAWVNLFLCGFNVLIFLYFTEVNRTCSVDFIEIYFLLYGVINAQVYVRINIIRRFMKKRQISLSDILLSVVDKVKMCGFGIVGVMKNWRYVVVWALCTFIFAYFLTFFKDGAGKTSLLFGNLEFNDKIWILSGNLHGMLTNFTSIYGWFIILASIMQGLAISLLVFNYRHKQNDLGSETSASGFGVLLSFLALGCPSCGVSMLTPLIMTVLGAGALALVDIVGKILMIVVFILLSYAIIKLGNLSYVTLSAKKYKERNGREKTR